MNDTKEILNSILLDLPNKSRKIAHYINDNYYEIPSKSITEISEELEVGIASISRFINTLGFKNIKELKQQIQSELVSKLTEEKKIQITMEKLSSNETDKIVEYYLNLEKENIDKLRRDLSNINLDEIVKCIKNSEKVFLLGLGISESVIRFLEYRLLKLGYDIKVIIDDSRKSQMQLDLITNKDVVIAVGFHRPNEILLEHLNVCKKKGATTIALTNSKNSLLTTETDYYIPAKRGPISIVNSVGAPIIVSNILFVLLKKGEEHGKSK